MISISKYSLRRNPKFFLSKIAKTPKTFYEILEITNSATEKEIKSSYLSKAKVMHPDTLESPSESANQAFQELNEAYQTLKNPVTRKMYDINLKNGVNRRPEDVPNFSDMRDAKKFYENRWYTKNPNKYDLRFTEDFTTEYNDFLKGGASRNAYISQFISEKNYEKLVSFRSKFLIMLGFIIFFEWIFSISQKKEDTRLQLLHELEDEPQVEYSLLIQEYIDGRATKNNFLIE